MNKLLSRALTVFFLLGFCSPLTVMADTPTIIPDADPLARSRNLVFNGSFEEPHLENGFTFGGGIPGVDGDGYYYLSPNMTLTPFAVPDGWTTSGGGVKTYGR